MDPYVRWFIRSSLVWLGVGVVMGVWMAVDVSAVVYRPAHMHANLLGFVSMMIFGVAYHVLPRFSGTPLRSRQAAMVHVWVANAGLAALVVGWLVRGVAPSLAAWLLGSGALASAVGAFLFIGNIWVTVGAPGARPAVLQSVPARRA
jgi:cbb3-type cytochrome oxidase subunit 1